MELTLDEIYRLLLNSLKTEPESWLDDNGYKLGEKHMSEVYWIQNEDLGLTIWVANQTDGIKVSKLKVSKIGNAIFRSRDRDLPNFSWWRRMKLYKAYKNLQKRHERKTFDIEVSKKYVRKYKINSIFEKEESN